MKNISNLLILLMLFVFFFVKNHLQIQNQMWISRGKEVLITYRYSSGVVVGGIGIVILK